MQNKSELNSISNFMNSANMKWLEEQLKNPRYRNCEEHGEHVEALLNGRCRKCWEKSNNEEAGNKATADIVSLKILANIPKIFREANFHNYNATSYLQHEALEKILGLKKSTNLIMSGTTGTGKTHLLCALVDKALMSGKKAYFANFYELTDLKIHNKEQYKKLLSIDILAIDEVGASDSNYKGDLLFEIIDKRYGEGLPTYLATNLNDKELKDRISQPVRSRLAANFVAITANWQDYRLTNRGK